jgi:hypothetical protein
LIFSAASATRFEIGLATSPASFSIASVFFELSATNESNWPRTKSACSLKNSVGDLTAAKPFSAAVVPSNCLRA